MEKKIKMEHYFFLTREEILQDFEAQKSKLFISFEKRGMTDASFSFLVNLVLSIPDVETKNVCVNVRHNCLTNASLQFIKILEGKNVKVLVDNNKFKEGSMNLTEKIRNKLKKQEYESISLLAVIDMSTDNLLNRITNLDHKLAFEKLYKAHDVTQKKIDILTKNVNSLYTSLHSMNKNVDNVQEYVKTNTKQLEKISKHIERDCADNLIKAFPDLNLKSLTKKDYEDTLLVKHEIDAILLSGDGKTLIIAETKHDLADVASYQLNDRIADFYKSKQLNKLTSILESVKNVVGAACANIVRETKAQEIFENGFLLMSKENKYKVKNKELLDKMLQ